jgi:hypothetical protein
VLQVTETEFVTAASHEPKLVMFAQSVVHQCLEMHPDLTAAVDRARAAYVSTTKSSTRVDALRGDAKDGGADESPSGSPQLSRATGIISSNNNTDSPAGSPMLANRNGGAGRGGVGRGAVGGGGAEAAALLQQVRRLELALETSNREVAHLTQRAREREDQYDHDLAEMEEQLQEREARSMRLKAENLRLKDQVGWRDTRTRTHPHAPAHPRAHPHTHARTHTHTHTLKHARTLWHTPSDHMALCPCPGKRLSPFAAFCSTIASLCPCHF